MNYPAFSSFRELLTTWDESADLMKVKSLIDVNKLMLFFKKDGKIYGASENSRLIFARMKNPDDDTDEDWAKEADFSAFDLAEALKGNRVQSVFSYKDLDSINILDQEKVEKILSNKETDEEPADLTTKKDDTPGMTDLGEK
jgi:hypothetical protein